MKNYLCRTLAMVVLTLCLSGVAQGTLVGDTVTIRHYFPTITDIFSPLGNTTVAAGNSDRASLLVLPGYDMSYYSVDMEAASITVDFSSALQWTAGSTIFNGLLVSDLDDDSGFPLSGVSIATNIAAWGDDRLLLGSDYISFNFRGLAVTPDSFIAASLGFNGIEQQAMNFISDLEPQVAVPEPATLFLFGSGLVGFGFHVRRSRLF